MFLRKFPRSSLALLLVVMLLSISFFATVPTQALPLSLTEQQVLAEQYAPNYYFQKNERTYPVSVDEYVPLCNLNRTTGASHVFVKSGLTADTLQPYGPDHYLDNILGTNHDDRIIQYYADHREAYGYTVYCHFTYDQNKIIIQYWTFYFFNQGPLNDHEGDWEMTQVVLGSDQKPISTTFSQHESGVTAQWSDVEKENDHYTVYVARGSHANYYRYYSGGVGLANDQCGNDGFKLSSNDYDINLVNGAEPWLQFQGRWGNNEGGDSMLGQAGPLGPMFRQNAQMWDGLPWGDDVIQLNKNNLTVDWFYFNLPMIIIGLIVLFLLLAAFRIYRSHKKGKVKSPYFGILDFKGNRTKAIANMLAIIALLIGIVALFLPYYVVSTNIESGPASTGGFQDILLIDGQQGVRINTLDPQAGLVQLTTFPVALSLLLMIPLIFLVLNTVGVSDKRIARRYFGRGIVMLIPVIIILVLVASLSSLFVYFPEVNGVQDAKTIFTAVASSPTGGSKAVYLADLGETAQVRWSLGIGSYLLIVTGVLLMIAAILRSRSKTQDYPGQTAERIASTAIPPVQSPPQSMSEQPTFCPNCGTRSESGPICTNCGTKIR